VVKYNPVQEVDSKPILLPFTTREKMFKELKLPGDPNDPSLKETTVLTPEGLVKYLPGSIWPPRFGDEDDDIYGR